MMPYYLLFAWMFLCALLTESFVPRQRRWVQFVLCVIPAVAVSAMRDVSVGTDTLQYVNAARFMDSYGYEAYMELGGMYADYEPGFILLLWLCSIFGDSVRTLVVLSSILIVGLQYLSVAMLCKRPAVAYVLLFLVSQYYFGLTGMRQAIGSSVTLLAVVLMLRDRRMLSLVALLAAVSFHYTSLVAAPVLLLSKIKVPRRAIKWCAACAVAIFALGPLLPGLFSLLEKYDGYVSSGQAYLVSGRLMPVMQVVFFGAMTFCLTRESCGGPTLSGGHSRLVNMGVVASLIGILIGVSAFYVNLFYRFMYILLPIVIASVETVFAKRVAPALLLPKVVAYSACLFMFVAFQFVDTQWFGINPYVPVLA